MFRQVYESVPIPYMTAEQLGSSYLVGSPIAKLITDPTIYAEELRAIEGIYVARERIATSDTVVRLICENNTIVWPYAQPRNYSFNGVTGESLNDPVTNRPNIPFWDGITIHNVIMDADGNPWATHIFSFGQGWWPMNPKTLILDTSAGMGIAASTYGKTVLTVFTIDKKNNLLLSKGPENSYIELFDFTTGELLYTMNVSGIPEQIIPEDSARAYVYCQNGMLNLIDYVNRRILSTFEAPLPAFEHGNQYLEGAQTYSYDRFFRRLLGIQKLPNDPVDGSCTSRIRGWYPVPLPVKLMKPIPLVAPRKDRTVPYLTRLFGDAGEPIAGVHVQGSIEGVTAAVSPGISDNTGYAIVQAKSTATGAATITLSAEAITS